jgi:hypothetical protein
VHASWATLSPDESKLPALVVRLLLVVVSVALGASLGWQWAAHRSDDPRTEHADAWARDTADRLQALGADRGRSCVDALTDLARTVDLAGLRHDPWGEIWSLRCHGDLGVVHSAGPDRRWNTVDDIVALTGNTTPDR